MTQFNLVRKRRHSLIAAQRSRSHSVAHTTSRTDLLKRPPESCAQKGTMSSAFMSSFMQGSCFSPPFFLTLSGNVALKTMKCGVPRGLNVGFGIRLTLTLSVAGFV